MADEIVRKLALTPHKVKKKAKNYKKIFILSVINFHFQCHVMPKISRQRIKCKCFTHKNISDICLIHLTYYMFHAFDLLVVLALSFGASDVLGL